MKSQIPNLGFPILFQIHKLGIIISQFGNHKLGICYFPKWQIFRFMWHKPLIGARWRLSHECSDRQWTGESLRAFERLSRTPNLTNLPNLVTICYRKWSTWETKNTPKTVVIEKFEAQRPSEQRFPAWCAAQNIPKAYHWSAILIRKSSFEIGNFSVAGKATRKAWQKLSRDHMNKSQTV